MQWRALLHWQCGRRLDTVDWSPGWLTALTTAAIASCRAVYLCIPTRSIHESTQTRRRKQLIIAPRRRRRGCCCLIVHLKQPTIGMKPPIHLPPTNTLWVLSSAVGSGGGGAAQNKQIRIHLQLTQVDWESLVLFRSHDTSGQ